MRMVIVENMATRRSRAAGAETLPGARVTAEPARPPLWTATLDGEPLPRGAAREIAFVRGVPRTVPTQRARVWQRSALAQLLNRRPARPFSTALVLECRFWHGAMTGAADDSDVIEVLERAAVIASRRQVREKHVFCGYDSASPRVEIALRRDYRG